MKTNVVQFPKAPDKIDEGKRGWNPPNQPPEVYGISHIKDVDCDVYAKLTLI